MSIAPSSTLSKVQWMVAGLYAAAIILILIKAGQPSSFWWWLGAVPFALWIMAPISLPLAWRRCGWFLTVGIAIIAAITLLLYWQTMFGGDPSSTSALIFIFIPLYQWGAVGLVAGLALLFRRRSTR